MAASRSPRSIAGRRNPVYLSVNPFGAEGLAEGARTVHAVGCAGVEVSVSLLPEGVRPPALAHAPIAVVNVSWQSQRRADLRQCSEVARRVGARTLNVYPTLAPGHEPTAARAALLADVRAALESSGGDGPRLTLENALERPPGLAASFAAWRGILEEVGSPHFLGTLDAANFIASGDPVPPERLVDEAGALIGYVHAKGVVPFDADLSAREPFRRAWEGVGRWLAAPACTSTPRNRHPSRRPRRSRSPASRRRRAKSA